MRVKGSKGANGSEGGKGGMKGAKGTKGSEGNFTLGFKVPTTCDQKSSISTYSG